MNFQQARAIQAAVVAAEAALEERHPAAVRPAWFAHCVAQSARMSGEHEVTVSYRAERKVPLKPNQAWETSPTGPRLVETDETTGERLIVITRDTDQFIDLFKAVFDVSTGEIDIVVDTDLQAFDPEVIEHPK